MKAKTALFNQLRRLLTFEKVDGRLADLIRKHRDLYILRRLTPANYLYPKGSIRIAERHGIVFAMDISDYPDWSLYFHSETDSSANVLEYVNLGDTVLDIGGNIGQTALLLASRVGVEGQVYSFEPFPASIERFKRNLELNENIKNIVLNSFGLGDEETVVQMFQGCATNSAGNRVVSSDANMESRAVEEIVIKPLDDALATHRSITKVDFIKVDVEGFETGVVKGAEATLRKYRPTLFIELSDRNLREQGSSAIELLELLGSHGYRVVDAADKRSLTGRDLTNLHTDILCTFENLGA